MKFQPLILPLALWLFVGICITSFVPASPFIVCGVIILIALATYFSVRVFTHSKLPIIITSCVLLFLLSSLISGFSLINLLLIAAIGTLISQLITTTKTTKKANKL